MNTCFFIGHRDTPYSIFPRLCDAVNRHITDFGVHTFIAGRYGSFDRMAARAVILAKQLHPKVRLLALLPYYDPLKKPCLPFGFDGSVYPDGLETVPKRVAIVRANEYMIRHCEYLIAYDCGHIGNTRSFIKTARTCEATGRLHIENLALQ